MEVIPRSTLPLEEKYLSYLRQGFEKWYKFDNLGFLPFAVVGYDPRYVVWGDKEAVLIERDPNKFYNRLELASQFLGEVLWIHEFNNFFEDTQIEPTKEEGFVFLETLKNFLQSYRSKKS